jgi:stage V sporulation protein SpoVS
MKNSLPKDTAPFPDCTCQLVAGAVGLVLIRSDAVVIKALGAAITMLSTLQTVKKMARLVE